MIAGLRARNNEPSALITNHTSIKPPVGRFIPILLFSSYQMLYVFLKDIRISVIYVCICIYVEHVK